MSDFVQDNLLLFDFLLGNNYLTFSFALILTELKTILLVLPVKEFQLYDKLTVCDLIIFSSFRVKLDPPQSHRHKWFCFVLWFQIQFVKFTSKNRIYVKSISTLLNFIYCFNLSFAALMSSSANCLLLCVLFLGSVVKPNVRNKWRWTHASRSE